MKKLILLFCVCNFLLNAQLPNFDLEQGDLSNWNIKNGSRLTSPGYSLTSIATCTNAVTSWSACGNYIFDSINYKVLYGVSIIPPNYPGMYVLYQMASYANDWAAVAEYSFVVSATQNTIGINRLIFLTQVPSELPNEDSFAEIRLVDMNGNTIPGSQEIYSNSTYSNSTLTSTAGAKYLPWTTYTRSVGAYMGQPVTLRLVSSLCMYGGHDQISVFDWYNPPVITGLNSNDPNKQLTIIPNPANEIITITNSENKEMQIHIYDLQGREVIKDSNKNINISALEKGMYIIKAVSENKVYSRSFIKN